MTIQPAHVFVGVDDVVTVTRRPPVVVPPAVPVLVNGGFETPALAAGQFKATPTGATWIFVGNSGISANSSGYTSGNSAAPEGKQVAYVQLAGKISQAIIFDAGWYVLSLKGVQRLNNQLGTQIISVQIDGVEVGRFQPSNIYTAYTTPPFTVTAGSHVIAIAGVGSGGSDFTAFVDDVKVAVSTAPTTPPPQTTPPPAAKFSIAGTAYPTLQAGMEALADGQTLTIAPGQYPGGGRSTANNITITCPTGEAVFSEIYAGPVNADHGKSTFVLYGDNVTLTNVSGVDIVNSSQNGGLVRYDPPAPFPKRLTLNNVAVPRCQTGILIGNNDSALVTINGFHGIYNAFPYNGYADWHAHAIYQGVGGELYINNADIRFTLQGGHLIKSRARKTIIRDSILIEGAGYYANNVGGVAGAKNVGTSRAIDLPNGGVFEAYNTYIRQSAISDNTGIIGYGAETNLIILNFDDSTATDWTNHSKVVNGAITLDPGWSWKYSVWTPSSIFIDPTVHCWDYHSPLAGKIINNGVPSVRQQPSPNIDNGTYNIGTDPHPPSEDPQPPTIPSSTEEIIPIVRQADGTIAPSFWASLPRGRWLGLANTSPMEQLKPLLRAGYVDFGSNPIDANSNDWVSLFEGGGGAGAEYRRPYLVGTGGGHFNSSNDGVYELDITTMRWRWRAQPSTDTYLPEDNVPAPNVQSDYWKGWHQNTLGVTKKGEAITPRFGSRYFSVAYNGDDETRDGKAGSVHSYAALALLPNNNFLCSFAYHYWQITPTGEWLKGGPNFYGPDAGAQFWNGKMYRFGRIDGNSRIYRYDPVTQLEDMFIARKTDNTYDANIGFGAPMKGNWIEPSGKLYLENGNFHADLTLPNLGCTYHAITAAPGTPVVLGDSSVAYHSIRQRAYCLGWGVGGWGKLYEIDSTSSAPKYTQIATTIGVGQPQYPTNKRFWVDETLDCLFLAAWTGRNVQVYRL